MKQHGMNKRIIKSYFDKKYKMSKKQGGQANMKLGIFLFDFEEGSL